MLRPPSSPDTKLFLIHRVRHYKVFFITNDGHMGLRLKFVRPSDLIHVSFRGQLPFVLRLIS